jgi:hypothetical protein
VSYYLPYASLAAVDLKLCVILTNVGCGVLRKKIAVDTLGNRVTCVRVTVATASNNNNDSFLGLCVDCVCVADRKIEKGELDLSCILFIGIF